MKYDCFIAFCSALLLMLTILLDTLLDHGAIVFNNIPDFAVSGLQFFSNNTIEIVTVLLFTMVISMIIGIIQYIKEFGKGEIA